MPRQQTEPRRWQVGRSAVQGGFSHLMVDGGRWAPRHRGGGGRRPPRAVHVAVRIAARLPSCRRPQRAVGADAAADVPCGGGRGPGRRRLCGRESTGAGSGGAAGRARPMPRATTHGGQNETVDLLGAGSSAGLAAHHAAVGGRLAQLIQHLCGDDEARSPDRAAASIRPGPCALT